MSFQEDLINCQSILYKGFLSTKSSGLSWLNDFCAEFYTFCERLHNFLVSSGIIDRQNFIESSFLCLMQITCCIKNLEKTIKFEENEDIVLSMTRQHFLDRILWCFARLKSVLNSVNDDILNSSTEINFVVSIDLALDLISPYSSYQVEEIQNIAKHNAEAMFDSKQIRSTIDCLLSQALSFSEVAIPNDQKAITALCQKVLKACLDFQEECSLNQSNCNETNRHLKAVLLENALFQLEAAINESLLNLVFRSFVDCSRNGVNKLRDSIKSNASNNELDEEISEFDLTIDRITQIGIFAMALTQDIKVKTTVKSCLASLESLDSNLIPSLQSQCIFHSQILEDHYNEELEKFKSAIQEIIDTEAICSRYNDTLSDSIKINEDKLDKHNINDILEMGKVLDEHLIINSLDLEFEKNDYRREQYRNFKLMLDECMAILACADQVESSRVIKRLKILRSMLKKLKQSLNPKKNESPIILGLSQIEEESNKKFINSDELIESKRILETFGIKPIRASILYRNREKFNITDSLRGNTSKLSTTRTFTNHSEKVKRRVSLRVAMFKRQKSNESKTVWESYNSQLSMGLQITDILDQITNLSTTFST